jgi:hypothetical protein
VSTIDRLGEPPFQESTTTTMSAFAVGVNKPVVQLDDPDTSAARDVGLPGADGALACDAGIPRIGVITECLR